MPDAALEQPLNVIAPLFWSLESSQIFCSGNNMSAGIPELSFLIQRDQSVYLVLMLLNEDFTELNAIWFLALKMAHARMLQVAQWSLRIKRVLLSLRELIWTNLLALLCWLSKSVWTHFCSTFIRCYEVLKIFITWKVPILRCISPIVIHCNILIVFRLAIAFESWSCHLP